MKFYLKMKFSFKNEISSPFDWKFDKKETKSVRLRYDSIRIRFDTIRFTTVDI